MIPLHLVVAVVVGWVQNLQQEALEYVRTENRILKAQLRRRRLHLTDRERRQLAVVGKRLGHRLLTQFASIVTPDTILRWHRQLIAQK